MVKISGPHFTSSGGRTEPPPRLDAYVDPDQGSRKSDPCPSQRLVTTSRTTSGTARRPSNSGDQELQMGPGLGDGAFTSRVDVVPHRQHLECAGEVADLAPRSRAVFAHRQADRAANLWAGSMM